MAALKANDKVDRTALFGIAMNSKTIQPAMAVKLPACSAVLNN
jgi:hypothetical protein